MPNTSKLLSEFRVSEDNLRADAAILQASNEYRDARAAYSRARRELLETSATLHELLDEPLRNAGLIPEGKEWTLQEDNISGLLIRVWSEPRRRGRRKPEVPTKQLAFPDKETDFAMTG